MRLNCVSGSVLALGATTLLAASAAFGQCNNTCPVGGIPQNDACGGLTPDPNGGCNFDPVQYQDIGAIAVGSPKTVCGTVGTFGEGSRDLDWYRISLATPGKVRVTVNNKDAGGVQATNFTIFIINGDDCDTQITEYAVPSGACPFVSDEIPLPAGNHVVILTVNAFAPDPPACPVTYTGLIEVTANLPPQCGGTESCTEAHLTGGCSNLACCDQVCAFSGDCCTLAWDQLCVELAVKLCGLFIYTCPPAVGAPPNNCATDASPIACGATDVALDNTNATTDGPPNDACAYGKDVWFVVEFDQVGGGELEMLLDTPTWDSTLALYALGPSPTFDPNELPALFIGCIDAQAAGGEAVVLIDAVEGDYYLIQVAGFDSGGGISFGPGDLSLTCRRSIFDTGTTSPVNFDATNMGNYTATNLGWSSGNLNAANAQRWAAQPFTAGNLDCGEKWKVTAIHGYGFTPVGVANEELCYKIWKRFAFTTAPNPSTAPNYQLVTEGCVEYPVPFDIAGGPTDEDFEMPTDFQLGAGDYWLTIYASNPSGVVPANWAWFTNAQGGIGYTPDANPLPGLWRAQLWPVPGFIVYRLPATQLMQTTGLDPFKVYASGFRLIGTKRPGTCQADLNGDGQVNGGDLGILIADWGVVDSCANFDDSADGVGGGDLGILIADFGPCPVG